MVNQFNGMTVICLNITPRSQVAPRPATTSNAMAVSQLPLTKQWFVMKGNVNRGEESYAGWLRYSTLVLSFLSSFFITKLSWYLFIQPGAYSIITLWVVWSRSWGISLRIYFCFPLFFSVSFNVQESALSTFGQAITSVACLWYFCLAFCRYLLFFLLQVWTSLAGAH